MLAMAYPTAFFFQHVHQGTSTSYRLHAFTRLTSDGSTSLRLVCNRETYGPLEHIDGLPKVYSLLFGFLIAIKKFG